MSALYKNAGDKERLRLTNKFLESDFEKVDRLLEMHDQYETRVLAADRNFEARRRAAAANDEDDEDEYTEDEKYLNRLDKGLYILQLVDLVLAFVCTDLFFPEVCFRFYDYIF